MRIAVTRAVSPALAECELTYLSRIRIDLARAQHQHDAYVQTLANLGCVIATVDPAPELPDSVFVEDTAIVLDRIAVITRPGAESRRPETAAVADTLRKYRPLVTIEPPGTLDGGDVMRIGKDIYVGRSKRSNASGIEQLQMLTATYGYTVHAVDLSGCLHLKSAVTCIAQDTILLNPAWVHADNFPRMRIITIDPAEPHAANALPIGSALVYPDSFPRTRDHLVKSGFNVVPVDVSELQKAEGAVTCCSLVLDTWEG